MLNILRHMLLKRRQRLTNHRNHAIDSLSVATMTMDYTVRLYVGFEYECPRGHRFFLSAPDKIFKAPSTGIFKVCVYMTFIYVYGLL